MTWPTPAMREAMAQARVGDDVFGEDPTINELETLAAAKVGKEAGLFVTSGTMGNLVGTLSQATRGDQAIVGQDTHTFRAEAGGMAALGGVVPCPLPTDGLGQMDPAAIEAAISPDDPHYPRTRLIMLENSYGARNGAPLPPDYFATVAGVARRRGLAVHLDGARLFNATVALGVAPAEITRHVDTVTFCLSKGLCAPAGSLLCGPAEIIYGARRVRKMLGGGMRQAGVLAAAGIVALEEMVDRLAEDHAHAQLLAQGLARIPGVAVDPAAVRTNIVFFSLQEGVRFTAGEVAEACRREADVWLGTAGPRRFRAVTHYWVGRREVATLLEVLGHVLAGPRVGQATGGPQRE
ncbi:MAG: aminotransferase class I/II-fold pyridoxal phosphate-dependent enzyme [Chloroflexi bacterium]|nr:aminotransferase class I/II-fold pyridoxal phosphate-dependent enzyme [Chloroflexota bacterium]MCI0730259.1 aminotransferase class I/II-fold pyridoxal phosphate-dependent enzyme [Chloroflexota bacterium]